MASYTWNVVSGDWGTSADWAPFGHPGSTDDAVVDSTAFVNGGGDALDLTLTGSNTVTVDSSIYNIGSVLAVSSAGLVLNGTTLTSNTLEMSSGEVTLQNDAFLTTLQEADINTSFTTVNASVSVDDSIWQVGTLNTPDTTITLVIGNTSGSPGSVSVQHDGDIRVYGELHLIAGNLDLTTFTGPPATPGGPPTEASGTTAQIVADQAEVGDEPGKAALNVSGTGSFLTVNTSLFLGPAGTMTVRASGDAKTSGLVVENGTLTLVLDNDTTGQVTPIIEPGGLNVTTGGTVTISLGATLDGGAVSVDGAGSTLTDNGDLFIGSVKSGGLSVTNGGSVSAAGGFIANPQNATSDILVDGAGSTLMISGNLNFEVPSGEVAGGTSALVAAGGGVITVGGTVTMDTGSSIDVGLGSATTGGPLGDGTGEVVIGNATGSQGAVTIAPGSLLVGKGSVIGPVVVDGDVIGNIVDDGTVESASGLLTLSGPVTGTGALKIDGGGTLEVTGAVAATAIATFAIGGGTLLIDDPADFAAPITNFTPGDAIAFAPGTVTTADIVGSTLHVALTGGGTTDYALTGNFAAATVATDTDGGIIVNVPCFAAGTRVRTDHGEVAVEDLRIGDLVQTVLGDSAAPIIWIGHRDVDCARHPKPCQVWPIRITAGAFGPGRPHSDLFLSPDHAVYVEKVLIPVKHLLNGTTITQIPVVRVTYHHLELAVHDVLLAEGLSVESFLDLRDGSNYVNRPGPVRLYPDFTARMWEAFGCARLIVTGPELTAARARVNGYAQQAAA